MKRSYLPRPSLPGTAPGAQIPAGLQCWAGDSKCARASGGPARSKCEDISVKPDRLQIAKGNFCPLAMKRLSTSLENKELDLNAKQRSFQPASQIVEQFIAELHFRSSK